MSEEKKKLVILYGEGFSQEELKQLSDYLNRWLSAIQYVVITNKPIESISRDELLKALGLPERKNEP